MHLSTEANGDQRQNTQTHGSPQTYLVVYVALMGLLLLTVFASSWGLGATWGLVVALSIAVTKALLVILYFMHVRGSSRVTWLFVAAGFVWLAILLGLVIVDYLTRSWFGA